jgi:tetrapyrrole methylase family protein/MazG family protein
MDAIDKLTEVVSRLRGEGGCPWDREQTLESLKQYLIEECYEVIDAVDCGDPEKHKEELGDLLLHIVLQAQIRNENGYFTFEDVAKTITDKLVRRHPHVFSGVSVSGTHEVLQNWEKLKKEERKKEEQSVLSGIPRHLPALQKAERVQSRAARVGFDWKCAEDVLSKITEEVEELRRAISEGNEKAIKHEIGDLLFAIVNFARHLGIHSEEALQETVSRFSRRFQTMENLARESGYELQECTLEQLEDLWQKAKQLVE